MDKGDESYQLICHIRLSKLGGTVNGDSTKKKKKTSLEVLINRCKFSFLSCNPMYFKFENIKFLDLEDRLAKEVRLKDTKFTIELI